MTTYFFRRILLIPLTFLGITLVVFTITRFVQRGPLERVMAQARFGGGEGVETESTDTGRGQASLTEEQLEELKAYYGFDKPVLVSYFIWLGKVAQFDLGTSTRYYDSVWLTIKDRLPISIYYGIMTTVLTYLICITLGVWKALNHNTYGDSLTSVLVFIGYAIPGFVVGIASIVIFAVNLEWFPSGGFMSEDAENWSLVARMGNILYHSALPLVAYMIGAFAIMTFMMKNTLLDNLASDYVRTAMAKGLNFRTAVFRHALRNSLIPIATHFGNNISLFVTGSFLIEKIFNINGLGLLGYESLVERDYPVVMGTLVITSLLQLVGNVLSDVCVALVDPRVQFR